MKEIRIAIVFNIVFRISEDGLTICFTFSVRIFFVNSKFSICIREMGRWWWQTGIRYLLCMYSIWHCCDKIRFNVTPHWYHHDETRIENRYDTQNPSSDKTSASHWRWQGQTKMVKAYYPKIIEYLISENPENTSFWKIQRNNYFLFSQTWNITH